MGFGKMLAIVVCAGVLFGAVAGQSLTLDFEAGLTGGWTKLTDFDPGYGGFTWDENLWLFHESQMLSSYGAPHYPSSDEALVVLASPPTVTVETNSPIELNGAYFAAMYGYSYPSSLSAKTITIHGYLGGSHVGSASTPISHYSFTYLPVNFASPIDSFTITGSGGLYNYQYWIMDDLEYVPEPTTALLLATGLLGLTVAGRRRDQAR